MTTQQKRPIVFMVIDVITFLGYYIMLTSVQEEIGISIGELSFWGGSILLLAPILIISRIVFYLVYSLIKTAITRKKEEKFLIDEFGEIIKLKASRNFSNAFMISFMVTMGFMVGGISINTMFKLFFFSIFAAFIVHNLSEFYYTKKGV